MGTIKLIFGLFLIAACVYMGAELIPAYYSNYEFSDAVKTEALMSTNSTKSEDAIRDTVFKKAQELEIPLTHDEIKVVRVGGQGTGSVTIEAPYNVHLDLVAYPMDLHFNVSTQNKGAF
ncbi:MAG: hypothetical protein JOZ43_09575 [Acidobacteriales bacterium]|nr:hypothetical protein [Terriglobales bacterium]MBV9671192.1 hypothetical protein [Terriglobales bacterium]